MWILVPEECGGIDMALSTQAAIELRELIQGAFALRDVVKPLMDGVDFEDFPKVVMALSEGENQKKFYEAIEGISHIGAEIGSITLKELTEIVDEFTA